MYHSFSKKTKDRSFVPAPTLALHRYAFHATLVGPVQYFLVLGAQRGKSFAFSFSASPPASQGRGQRAEFAMIPEPTSRRDNKTFSCIYPNFQA